MEYETSRSSSEKSDPTLGSEFEVELVVESGVVFFSFTRDLLGANNSDLDIGDNVAEAEGKDEDDIDV